MVTGSEIAEVLAPLQAVRGQQGKSLDKGH